MLAMQYRFDFAPGRDMPALRQRVATIGPQFDALSGLLQKAFLVSDADIGQPDRYSPFYVWNDHDGMRDFLLSDAFVRLCTTYERPSVVTWVPLLFERRDTSRAPRHAVQETLAIAPATPLAQCRDDAVAQAAREQRPGLQSIFVGVDPQRWQLTRVLLWHDIPEVPDGADLYDVCHLSSPP